MMGQSACGEISGSFDRYDFVRIRCQILWKDATIEYIFFNREIFISGNYYKILSLINNSIQMKSILSFQKTVL
jgi:hypothetical protein